MSVRGGGFVPHHRPHYSRFHLRRACYHRNSYDESPRYVGRRRQPGMGWGVRALRFIPAGTQCCKYGGKLICGYGELATHQAEHFDSDKLMQIRYGSRWTTPVWVDATGDSSLGGYVNYGCGHKVDCAANVEHVFDDENRLDCWLVASRDILKGEFLFFDYGYHYDEERDGNDPTMGWMKGMRCPVCYPYYLSSPPAVLRVEPPELGLVPGFTPLFPCRLIPDFEDAQIRKRKIGGFVRM